MQIVDAILQQDTGIQFCDKAHLKCERNMVQCFLLPTHQLWHQAKWMPTPKCTCEFNLEIWWHFFLCLLKELPIFVVLQEHLITKLYHFRKIEKIVGSYCLILIIVLWSTFSRCRIHRLCPFLHNPIIPGLMHFRFQTIAMCHCQKKVVHVLLLIMQFAVFNTNDYFVLMAFQMAWLTLYVI